MVQQFGWRVCFFTVTAMASVAVLGLGLFPKLPRKARMPGHVLAGYTALLSSRRFVGYVVSHGLGFGSLLTFVLAAPYVVTTHAHEPISHFALMQLVLVSFFAIGANTAPHVVNRVGSDATILTGCSLQVLGGVGLFIVTATMQPVTVTAMAACMAIVNLGHGLRGGVGLARVMDILPGHTGSASALMVFITVGIGSIATPVIAPFLPTGAVVVGCAVVIQVVGSLAVLPLAISTRSTTTSAAE
jgi:DHA1 family bicyclomycin/chloramphenicol resistance-like MFS transporter